MSSFAQAILKKIICFASLFIMVLLLAGFVWSKPNRIGIVTVENLNMRSGAGIKVPPLMKLKKGARICILDQNNGWLKVKYKGRIGYIKNLKEYVKILKEKQKIKKKSSALKTIANELKKGKAKVITFTKKETAVINSLGKTDIALNRARRIVSILRAELADIEEKIKENRTTIESLKKRIQIREKSAYSRLVALYKLNRLGKVYLLASAESITDLCRRQTALKRILAYDDNILKDLSSNKAGLEKMQKKICFQKTNKLSIQSAYKDQISVVSSKRAKKLKLLADIKSKKSLEMAAIASLEKAAATLNRTINSFSSKPDKIESFNTKVFLSDNGFTFLKGRLKMPVKGEIISFFGNYTDSRLKLKSFRKGIDIKAERGEPIRAVYDGLIIYSSWFKGYGNLIIVDHGNNYYTLYAHTEELFKTKGDSVETGEVVATVGDTGSITGAGLYFEIRHYGKPVDPLKWIEKI